MKNSIFLVMVLVFYSVSAAQEIQESVSEKTKKTETLLERTRSAETRDVITERTSLVKALTTNQIFENKINPKDYIVGPGDQFVIYIGGIVQKVIPVTILPEGSVIIPQVGVLDAKEMSLEEFRLSLSEKLKENYHETELEIFIIQLRKFRVHITGRVKYPGTYFVDQIDRLSSAIELAGGVNSWADQSRIQIKNAEVQNDYNLWLFYSAGSLAQNPSLKQGDIVFVPEIDLEKEYVKVEGQTEKEGYFPIMKNERLTDFLNRIAILDQLANVEEIALYRGEENKSINLGMADSNIFLKHRDVIRIPKLRREVYVTGEVLKPGPYVYNPNYTAWDYIAEAGILESAVSVDKVEVLRFTDGQLLHGKNTIVHSGDIVRLNRKFREDLKDYLGVIIPTVSIILTFYIAYTN